MRTPRGPEQDPSFANARPPSQITFSGGTAEGWFPVPHPVDILRAGANYTLPGHPRSSHSVAKQIPVMLDENRYRATAGRPYLRRSPVAPPPSTGETILFLCLGLPACVLTVNPQYVAQPDGVVGAWEGPASSFPSRCLHDRRHL